MIETFPSQIDGVRIVKASRFEDSRGSFEETFNEERFREAQLPTTFVQDNTSVSYKGVLRGLHIQSKNPQGKFIRCLVGRVYDVWVDLRPDSKTFKKVEAMTLSGLRSEAIYLPPGLAHGFFCMTDAAVLHYKCTTLYDKESDSGIYYKDRDLKIDWPFGEDFDPLISGKDANLPSLAEYLERE